MTDNWKLSSLSWIFGNPKIAFFCQFPVESADQNSDNFWWILPEKNPDIFFSRKPNTKCGKILCISQWDDKKAFKIVAQWHLTLKLAARRQNSIVYTMDAQNATFRWFPMHSRPEWVKRSHFMGISPHGAAHHQTMGTTLIYLQTTRRLKIKSLKAFLIWPIVFFISLRIIFGLKIPATDFFFLLLLPHRYFRPIVLQFLLHMVFVVDFLNSPWWMAFLGLNLATFDSFLP